MVDLTALRAGIAAMDSSVAHSASGYDRPVQSEIFAPVQHAGALDPNTAIVLGARGSGKSFWAGVLGDRDTREATATAYPSLNLEHLSVRFGFTGLSRDGSVSRATLDALVPVGQERLLGTRFWRCVVLRALLGEVENAERPPTVNHLMGQYADRKSGKTRARTQMTNSAPMENCCSSYSTRLIASPKTGLGSVT